MLLHEIVEAAARRAPEAPAVVFEGAATSFAELHRRSTALSAAVAATVEPGTRIAVLAHNRPEYVECGYGVPAGGAVLVPLNQRQHPREWAEVIERAGAEVLVGDRELLDAAREHLRGLRRRPAVVAFDRARPGEQGYAEWVASAGAPAGPADGSRQDTDVAWLLFTSGTTGRPKGAMLTHRSLLAAVVNTALARRVHDDDVYGFPFPLCHVAAYNVPLFHLHARPVVLFRRFDPELIRREVPARRVTTLSLAPTMLAILLDAAPAGSAGLPPLRTISYGASPMPPALVRRSQEVLGCDLAQGYGMTELSGNAVFLGPQEHRRAIHGEDHLLRAAGRAGPLAQVRVVDGAGHDVAPGDVGEIAVRGDQVMAGYWDDPEATRAALARGWLRTGDVGRLAPDGTLSVVDRKKDVIVTGGENVASREVEDVLADHPSVRAVAVVGVPDATWGEVVCAVVVGRDGAVPERDDLVAFARARLGGYKCPRHVLVVDALPTNGTGKLVKAEIRALARSRLAADPG